MCNLDICKALVNLSFDEIEEEETMNARFGCIDEKDPEGLAGRIYI